MDIKTKFGGRLLMIGCGSVAKCVVQLLLKHLDMDYSRMTIIDPIDYSATEEVADILSAGATYICDKVTPENIDSLLGQYVSSGDMILDLSVNVGTLSVASWCFKNDVMYLNTSVEEWEININNEDAWAEDTLYNRHTKLREHMESLGKEGPTVVVEHGANPGLASHWAKAGLEDIATRLLQQPVLEAQRRAALEEALEAQDFASLGMLTGTKVIHISEQDSQTVPRQRQNGEFMSTWSCDGFYQESLAIAEIGWGTHEKELPAGAITYNHGPQNKIAIRKRAMEIVAKSWVPSGNIEGMVIPHGEAYTISDKLTLRKNGKAIYRPSVYFVYRPTKMATASLLEYADSGKDSPDGAEIMTNEISTGIDEVGTLLIGHDLGAWWTGSRLSIEETRKHVRNTNATVLQVAASVMAAFHYMTNNQRQGFCTAEDLPHREILKFAAPYLGESLSIPSPFRPRSCAFSDFVLPAADRAKAV